MPQAVKFALFTMHWCLRHFWNWANYSVNLISTKLGTFTDNRQLWKQQNRCIFARGIYDALRNHLSCVTCYVSGVACHFLTIPKPQELWTSLLSHSVHHTIPHHTTVTTPYHHVSCVPYHKSDVKFHLSLVMYHISGVTCHTFFLLFFSFRKWLS